MEESQQRPVRASGVDPDARTSPHPSRSAWAGPVVVRVLVAAGGVVAILALAWGLDAALTGDRIHPGVTVGGTDVGGSITLNAQPTLEKAFAARRGVPVVVRDGARTWKLHAEDVGAAIDTSRSAAAAWRIGRTGSVLIDLGQRARAWFGAYDLDARVTVEPDGLSRFVDQVERDISIPARDATVVVGPDRVELVSAKEGLTLDRRRMAADVRAAFGAVGRGVTVHTLPVPFALGDDAAQQAVVEARSIVSGPAAVLHARETWPVSVAALRGWIAFRQVTEVRDADGEWVTATEASAASESSPTPPPATPVAERRVRLQAFLRPDAIDAAFASRLKGIGRASVNASILAEEGKVTIVPGSRGMGPDVPRLAEELRVALTGGGPRVARLVLGMVEPEISTDDIAAMGVRTRIGKFTTTFSPVNRARVSNIHTLAKALDNTLIAPGAEFSFNGRIGERTAAKGYREAPAIVNGKLEPQLGGGICQVGTTIFNSVFFSGLPILERKNHSFYISHYPKGRDCTISWRSPDFRFRNDTGHWVLIRTSFTSGSLTVSLYGTDPGYRVEYTTSDFEDVKPHGTETIPDPTLAVGKKAIDEPGVDGGKVTVVRTVYKGAVVVRRDTFVSHYRPKDEVVRIGTKASVPATSTP